ncbi:dihydropteroate synthase [Neisseria sp. Ec49-e6-T10]|uniref:dihydropteroate synthase n=1 Tax=Neisseria sp. Ec49-e6-T10 TaxID=3140744 RepID=UPI003EBB73BD
MQLNCGRFELDLTTPKVMGILNVTPDSFSDGGQFKAHDLALEHAKQMIEQGVDIIDVGAESTRPNAAFVSEEEEWARLEPILSSLQNFNVPISLDTRRTSIMKKALAEGWVDLVNDVSALEDEGAVELLAKQSNTAICLMHKQGNPENMQKEPYYEDVVAEVSQYLQDRVQVCKQAGIDTKRLLVDPGFGFGKTLAHNLALMNTLDQWAKDQEVPVLIGISRKNMLGKLVNEPEPKNRMVASVVAALAACARGAKIVRVHDVKETVQALTIWQHMGVFI